MTPWDSYLGGEEYEPDAKQIENDPASDGSYNDKVRSYWLGDNGWITEVDVNGNSQAKFEKYYAMGRFSHLILVREAQCLPVTFGRCNL